MDVAELVGMGADGVREAMAGVENAKVIDDDEIRKARRFRDAMDDLKGVAESLTISVGEGLVPALSEAAENATFAADALGSVVDRVPEGWIEEAFEIGAGPLGLLKNLGDMLEDDGEKVVDLRDDWSNAMETIASDIDVAKVAFDEASRATAFYAENMHGAEAAIDEAVEAQERQNKELDEQRDRFEDAADAVYSLHDAEYAASKAIEDANEALETEGGNLFDIRQKTERAAVAIGNMADEQVVATGVTRDSAQGQRVWTEKMLESAATLSGPLQRETLAYIARMNGIPEEKITEIMAQDNAAAILMDHLARIGAIPREVSTRLRVTGQTVTRNGDSIGVRAIGNIAGVYHDGGVVPGPRGSDQLIMAAGGETILPTHKPGATPGASSGGIYVAPGGIVVNGNITPEKIVDALRMYERRNGPGWRQ
jgi:hypothetical protein